VTVDAVIAGDGSIARAHAELLTDRSIQFTLAPPPQPPESGSWFATLIEALAPFVVYIFWGGVALIAAFLLYLVISHLSGYSWTPPWRRTPLAADADDDWRPDRRIAQTLLADADALAERGDYEAAVHLLLVRSVEDIARRRPSLIKPSLTARDIAADDRLPDSPRSAFARIAGIVERSLFAHDKVGGDGWRAARQAYEEFAFPSGWRVGAR